jgi:hypothetical protein
LALARSHFLQKGLVMKARILFFAQILLIGSPQAFSQIAPEPHGQITGFATNEAGVPIIQAEILTWPGGDHSFYSAGNGAFAIDAPIKPNLALIVSAPGYHPVLRSFIKVDPDRVCRIDFVLARSSLNPPRVICDQPLPREIEKYRGILKSFNEPPFLPAPDAPSNNEIYRFLWLRGFHPSILIKLEIFDEEHATITYKELVNEDDPAKTKLAADRKNDYVKLAMKQAGEYDRNEAKLAIFAMQEQANTGLWSQPFRVDDGGIHLEGSDCIIEGRKGSESHLVMRWSPFRTEDPVGAFAEALMQNCGKRFYFDEVY